MKKTLLIILIAILLGSVAYANSDFDNDGTVGFPDFLAFANAFGTTPADPTYDSVYDLDSSGSVDFPDFLTFANDFGNTVSAPHALTKTVVQEVNLQCTNDAGSAFWSQCLGNQYCGYSDNLIPNGGFEEEAIYFETDDGRISSVDLAYSGERYLRLPGRDSIVYDLSRAGVFIQEQEHVFTAYVKGNCSQFEIKYADQERDLRNALNLCTFDCDIATDDWRRVVSNEFTPTRAGYLSIGCNEEGSLKLDALNLEAIGREVTFRDNCAACGCTDVEIPENMPCFDLNFDHIVDSSDRESVEKCALQDPDYIQMCDSAGILYFDDIMPLFETQLGTETFCSLELTAELEQRGVFDSLNKVAQIYCPLPNCYAPEIHSCLEVGHTYSRNDGNILATCIDGGWYYNIVDTTNERLEWFCDADDVEVIDGLGSLVDRGFEFVNPALGSNGDCDPHFNEAGNPIELTGIRIGSPESHQHWTDILSLARTMASPFNTTSDNNVEFNVPITSDDINDYTGRCFGTWTPPNFVCTGEPTPWITTEPRPDLFEKWKIGGAYSQELQVTDDSRAIGLPDQVIVGTRNLDPNVYQYNPEIPDIEIIPDQAWEEARMVGTVTVTANVKNKEFVQLQVTDFDGRYRDLIIYSFGPNGLDMEITDEVIVAGNIDSSALISAGQQLESTSVGGVNILNPWGHQDTSNFDTTKQYTVQFEDGAFCYSYFSEEMQEDCLADDHTYRVRARILDEEGRPISRWKTEQLVPDVQKFVKPPYIEFFRQIEMDVGGFNDYPWTNPDIDTVLITDQNLGLANDLKWRFDPSDLEWAFAQNNEPPEYFFEVQYSQDAQTWMDLPGISLIDPTDADFKITEEVYKPHDWTTGPESSEDLYRNAQLGDVKYHRNKVALEKHRVMHMGIEPCNLEGASYTNCLEDGPYVYRVRAVNEDRYPLSGWGMSDYVIIDYDKLGVSSRPRGLSKVAALVTESREEGNSGLAQFVEQNNLQELDATFIDRQMLIHDIPEKYNVAFLDGGQFDPNKLPIVEEQSGVSFAIKTGINVAILVADHFFTGGVYSRMNGGVLKFFVFVGRTALVYNAQRSLSTQYGTLICQNSASCWRIFGVVSGFIYGGQFDSGALNNVLQQEANSQIRRRLMGGLCKIKSDIGRDMCGLVTDMAATNFGNMMMGNEVQTQKFFERASSSLKRFASEKVGAAACSQVGLLQNPLYKNMVCRQIGETILLNSEGKLRDFSNIQEIPSAVGGTLLSAGRRLHPNVFRYAFNPPQDTIRLVGRGVSAATMASLNGVRASVSAVRSLPGATSNMLNNLQDQIDDPNLISDIQEGSKFWDCTRVAADSILNIVAEHDIALQPGPVSPQTVAQVQRTLTDYQTTFGEAGNDQYIRGLTTIIETADGGFEATEIAQIDAVVEEGNICNKVKKKALDAIDKVKEGLSWQMEQYLTLTLFPVFLDPWYDDLISNNKLDISGLPQDDYMDFKRQTLRDVALSGSTNSRSITDQIGVGLDLLKLGKDLLMLDPDAAYDNIKYALALMYQTEHFELWDACNADVPHILGTEVVEPTEITNRDVKREIHAMMWHAMQIAAEQNIPFADELELGVIEGEVCLDEAKAGIGDVRDCVNLYILAKLAADITKIDDFNLLIDSDPLFCTMANLPYSCQAEGTSRTISDEVARILGDPYNAQQECPRRNFAIEGDAPPQIPTGTVQEQLEVMIRDQQLDEAVNLIISYIPRTFYRADAEAERLFNFIIANEEELFLADDLDRAFLATGMTKYAKSLSTININDDFRLLNPVGASFETISSGAMFDMSIALEELSLTGRDEELQGYWDIYARATLEFVDNLVALDEARRENAQYVLPIGFSSTNADPATYARDLLLEHAPTAVDRSSVYKLLQIYPDGYRGYLERIHAEFDRLPLVTQNTIRDHLAYARALSRIPDGSYQASACAEILDMLYQIRHSIEDSPFGGSIGASAFGHLTDCIIKVIEDDPHTMVSIDGGEMYAIDAGDAILSEYMQGTFINQNLKNLLKVKWANDIIFEIAIVEMKQAGSATSSGRRTLERARGICQEVLDEYSSVIIPTDVEAQRTSQQKIKEAAEFCVERSYRFVTAYLNPIMDVFGTEMNDRMQQDYVQIPEELDAEGIMFFAREGGNPARAIMAIGEGFGSMAGTFEAQNPVSDMRKAQCAQQMLEYMITCDTGIGAGVNSFREAWTRVHDLAQDHTQYLDNKDSFTNQEINNRLGSGFLSGYNFNPITCEAEQTYRSHCTVETKRKGPDGEALPPYPEDDTDLAGFCCDILFLEGDGDRKPRIEDETGHITTLVDINDVVDIFDDSLVMEVASSMEERGLPITKDERATEMLDLACMYQTRWVDVPYGFDYQLHTTSQALAQIVDLTKPDLTVLCDGEIQTAGLMLTDISGGEGIASYFDSNIGVGFGTMILNGKLISDLFNPLFNGVVRAGSAALRATASFVRGTTTYARVVDAISQSVIGRGSRAVTASSSHALQFITNTVGRDSLVVSGGRVLFKGSRETLSEVNQEAIGDFVGAATDNPILGFLAEIMLGGNVNADVPSSMAYYFAKGTNDPTLNPALRGMVGFNLMDLDVVVWKPTGARVTITAVHNNGLIEFSNGATTNNIYDLAANVDFLDATVGDMNPEITNPEIRNTLLNDEIQGWQDTLGVEVREQVEVTNPRAFDFRTFEGGRIQLRGQLPGPQMADVVFGKEIPDPAGDALVSGAVSARMDAEAEGFEVDSESVRSHVFAQYIKQSRHWVSGHVWATVRRAITTSQNIILTVGQRIQLGGSGCSKVCKMRVRDADGNSVGDVHPDKLTDGSLETEPDVAEELEDVHRNIVDLEADLLVEAGAQPTGGNMPNIVAGEYKGTITKYTYGEETLYLLSIRKVTGGRKTALIHTGLPDGIIHELPGQDINHRANRKAVLDFIHQNSGDIDAEIAKKEGRADPRNQFDPEEIAAFESRLADVQSKAELDSLETEFNRLEQGLSPVTKVTYREKQGDYHLIHQNPQAAATAYASAINAGPTRIKLGLLQSKQHVAQLHARVLAQETSTPGQIRSNLQSEHNVLLGQSGEAGQLYRQHVMPEYYRVLGDALMRDAAVRKSNGQDYLATIENAQGQYLSALRAAEPNAIPDTLNTRNAEIDYVVGLRAIRSNDVSQQALPITQLGVSLKTKLEASYIQEIVGDTADVDVLLEARGIFMTSRGALSTPVQIQYQTMLGDALVDRASSPDPDGQWALDIKMAHEVYTDAYGLNPTTELRRKIDALEARFSDLPNADGTVSIVTDVEAFNQLVADARNPSDMANLRASFVHLRNLGALSPTQEAGYLRKSGDLNMFTGQFAHSLADYDAALDIEGLTQDAKNKFQLKKNLMTHLLTGANTRNPQIAADSLNEYSSLGPQAERLGLETYFNIGQIRFREANGDLLRSLAVERNSPPNMRQAKETYEAALSLREQLPEAQRVPLESTFVRLSLKKEVAEFQHRIFTLNSYESLTGAYSDYRRIQTNMETYNINNQPGLTYDYSVQTKYLRDLASQTETEAFRVQRIETSGATPPGPSSRDLFQTAATHFAAGEQLAIEQRHTTDQTWFANKKQENLDRIQEEQETQVEVVDNLETFRSELAKRSTYDRLQDPEFASLYNAVKGQLTGADLFTYHGKLANAMNARGVKQLEAMVHYQYAWRTELDAPSPEFREDVLSNYARLTASQSQYNGVPDRTMRLAIENGFKPMVMDGSPRQATREEFNTFATELVGQTT